MHTHLSREDRTIIANGLQCGESYQAIGDRIGRDKSVISREVQRNKDEDGAYNARRAHRRVGERRRGAKVVSRKIEHDFELADAIERQLRPLVSPETIAHDLPVHHQSIYAWIYRSRPDLKKKLPHHGRRRAKYGQKGLKIQGWTTKVRSIEEMPQNAEEVWEGDTIRGGDAARLLTHVEQKSLFADVLKVANGQSGTIQGALKNRPLLHRVAILYDRGSEFSEWKRIEEDTASTIYFAHAGCPHERGKNENTNGRLRRVFPKKTKLSTISQKEVDELVWLMNHTKRKSLDWRTPCEVYGKCCISA